MIDKVFKHLYSLATILFVVGGLLLYQGNESGAIAICVGLLINVAYRIQGLNKENLKKLVFLDLLKLISAVFLAISVILFFFDIDALQYIIVAIVFDVILNINILPSKK